MGGQNSAECKRALEVHRLGHRDIDVVPMESLDAEVRRLCNASAQAQALAPRLTFAQEVSLRGIDCDAARAMTRAPLAGAVSEDGEVLEPKGKRGVLQEVHADGL